MRSFSAIAGWIADVPTELLALLYSTSPRTPARTPGGPSKTTLWRVLTGVDAAAVDAAIGSWLAEQARHVTTAAGTSPAGRACDAADRTDTEPVEQVDAGHCSRSQSTEDGARRGRRRRHPCTAGRSHPR
jgi:hypothetical protein